MADCVEKLEGSAPGLIQGNASKNFLSFTALVATQIRWVLSNLIAASSSSTWIGGATSTRP